MKHMKLNEVIENGRLSVHVFPQRINLTGSFS